MSHSDILFWWPGQGPGDVFLHPGASLQELEAAQCSKSFRVTYESQVSIPITWGIGLQTSKAGMQAATFFGPSRASYR